MKKTIRKRGIYSKKAKCVRFQKTFIRIFFKRRVKKKLNKNAFLLKMATYNLIAKLKQVL